MRKLKIFLIPFFALLLSTVSAVDTTSTIDNHIYNTAKENLRNEIADKISKIDFSSFTLKESTVKVQFLVNDKNEIIILRTDSKVLDNAIKTKLNYKEVNTKDIDRNTLYSISIKLVS